MDRFERYRPALTDNEWNVLCALVENKEDTVFTDPIFSAIFGAETVRESKMFETCDESGIVVDHETLDALNPRRLGVITELSNRDDPHFKMVNIVVRHDTDPAIASVCVGNMCCIRTPRIGHALKKNNMTRDEFIARAMMSRSMTHIFVNKAETNLSIHRGPHRLLGTVSNGNRLIFLRVDHEPVHACIPPIEKPPVIYYGRSKTIVRAGDRTFTTPVAAAKHAGISFDGEVNIKTRSMIRMEQVRDKLWKLALGGKMPPLQLLKDIKRLFNRHDFALDGVRFDSRLELRWATFLNVLGVSYMHEPTTHRMTQYKHVYTPDFRVWKGTQSGMACEDEMDADLAAEDATDAREDITTGSTAVVIEIKPRPDNVRAAQLCKATAVHAHEPVLLLAGECALPFAEEHIPKDSIAQTRLAPDQTIPCKRGTLGQMWNRNGMRMRGDFLWTYTPEHGVRIESVQEPWSNLTWASPEIITAFVIANILVEPLNGRKQSKKECLTKVKF